MLSLTRGQRDWPLVLLVLPVPVPLQQVQRVQQPLHLTQERQLHLHRRQQAWLRACP